MLPSVVAAVVEAIGRTSFGSHLINSRAVVGMPSILRLCRSSLSSLVSIPETGDNTWNPVPQNYRTRW
jgi:hypothetical protein